MADTVVCLVVDDEGGTVWSALDAADGVAVEGVDGDALADRLGSGDGDVVIVHDDPPDRDGVELFLSARAKSSVPVLLVGIDPTPDRIEAAVTAGVTDYLPWTDGPSLAARVRGYAARPMLDPYAQAAEYAEFGSGLSHDAKNPLNVVTGRLELLDVDSTHEDAIDRSLSRVGTLLDDLSTVGKLSRPVVDPEPTSIEAVATDVWGRMNVPDATLSVTATGDVPAEDGRLRELFERLFENAVTHGGDAVAVEVGETADGFYVADDGEGIPDDDRQRVFEGGYGTTREGEGYGLYVVKRIADAHGWTVDAVESETGGARIDVRTRRVRQ
ncbi:hybrid sensor histidine kinase/response regulator [Halomicroarcula sp. GCM10025709]|uniref:hybrid sensor histidine kinase/response regulator n=1 Tax=Haloarcula TaxID=2237 RepID=UPI0024C3C73E|nr:hybrid sensor histidine kinase/response regulator [Halomicroarcula sp. YJ-61-S]